MDPQWSEEQVELRRSLVDFARKELNSDLRELDGAEKFNREDWVKCASQGVTGLPFPEKYGGGGKDPLTTIHALEGLGYGCRDNGLLFGMNAQMWACQAPLLQFGTEEQIEKYLPGLCAGQLIGGHALSEPEAGSDAYNLSSIARREGDAYVLSGEKRFVTNGPAADVLIIFAMTDPDKGKQGISAFLVESNTPGLEIRRVSKLGLRTAQMGDITLNECRIPASNRLGREGGGVSVFSHGMEWERAFILAPAVGTMERILETCVDYARKRRQGGRAIGKYQMIQERIVEMKMDLETSRALLYRTARLKAAGRSIHQEAAMTKLHISEAWLRTARHAMRIFGGRGYLTEHEIERELRDAEGAVIYSGTSEIQKLIIAGFMGL